MVHSCEGNGITFVRSVAGQQQGRKGGGRMSIPRTWRIRRRAFPSSPSGIAATGGAKLTQNHPEAAPLPPKPNVVKIAPEASKHLFSYFWTFLKKIFFPAKKVKKGAFFYAISSWTKPFWQGGTIFDWNTIPHSSSGSNQNYFHQTLLVPEEKGSKVGDFFCVPRLFGSPCTVQPPGERERWGRREVKGVYNKVFRASEAPLGALTWIEYPSPS